MWAYESVFYQIYPLGFCGAPFENDGVLTPRIRKVIDWIPHIKNLGANAIYFSPVFESDTHGYNTRDFRKIDVRLGTNNDFADGHFRMCWKNAGIPRTKTGSISVLMAIPTTMTGSGMRAGKAIMTL